MTTTHAPPTDLLLSTPFYNFPATWTLQPNLATRDRQFKHWSSFIQRYCQSHRLWRLSVSDALQSALFHNSALRKRLNQTDVLEVLNWMSREEGGKRVEWVGGERGQRDVCWVLWRRPEEWAEVIVGWVEETGQKGVVLTLYELTEGETTTQQGMSCGFEGCWRSVKADGGQISTAWIRNCCGGH